MSLNTLGAYVEARAKHARPHTDADREVQRVAHLGKKHTVATKKKISDSRKTQSSQTIVQSKWATWRREHRTHDAALCALQLQRDLLAAMALGRPALLEDVRRSKGLFSLRWVWDHSGRVSDGMCFPFPKKGVVLRGYIRWSPVNIEDPHG